MEALALVQASLEHLHELGQVVLRPRLGRHFEVGGDDVVHVREEQGVALGTVLVSEVDGMITTFGKPAIYFVPSELTELDRVQHVDAVDAPADRRLPQYCFEDAPGR